MCPRDSRECEGVVPTSAGPRGRVEPRRSRGRPESSPSTGQFIGPSCQKGTVNAGAKTEGKGSRR